MDRAAFVAYRSWCLARGHSAKTVDKSVRYLMFFTRRWGLSLGELTPRESDVLEFLARRREEGVHPKTLNGYVRELNLWSRFRGLGWKLSYFRRHQPILKDLLTEADEAKLRQARWDDPALNARNHALVLLSLDQGPRRDEIRQAKLSDLVTPPGGGHGLLIRRGKGDRPRMLLLADDTWEALQEYITRYRIRSDREALFTSRKGPISYGSLGKIAKEIGLAAGVPHFGWHRGRHRMIDAMLDLGVPLTAIQEIAGHSRAETTVGYASRHAIRILTEREVRAFQKRRSQGVGSTSAEVGDLPRIDRVDASRAVPGGSTGI